jgi:hypothetical protein
MRSSDLPSDGSERCTDGRIVFGYPFTLGGTPEVYPAGMYQVETKKLPAEAHGHTACARSSTFLLIPTSSGTDCREVRRNELDEAIMHNSNQSRARELSENADPVVKGSGGMLL